jgi:hypothetical protein
MALSFDPKSPVTERVVKTQTDAWGIDEDTTYIVVDDCGPCIIAAFTFRHHAEAFLNVCGQECYMAGASGAEVDPDE